jgi:hypothetical protein
MKNLNLLIIAFIFTSCQISENSSVSSGSTGTLPSASTICSGTTVFGVDGTADCSGGISFLSFASRRDNGSFPDPTTFPLSTAAFDAFFATRSPATLAEEIAGDTDFSTKNSLVPNPLYDSDGRYAMNDINGTPIAVPAKRHYLETIAVNDANIATRANIVACGSTGTIAERIEDCATLNGLWAFYDGKKYGQDGEGDWKLVSVIGAGPKYEVWRDERTKLLWSDKTSVNYNWYQAAGYSKPNVISEAESEFRSQPGQQDPISQIWYPDLAGPTPDPRSIMQPASPVSVCIDAGVLNGGEGTSGYTYVGPSGETGDDTNGYSFKGNIISTQATWRLPSINDWKLADVNGIRKVLPNMDNFFWSSSSYSYVRSDAWNFQGGYGGMGSGYRVRTYSVRCVAPSRD